MSARVRTVSLLAIWWVGGASLGAGNFCSLVIVFHPLVAGPASSTVGIIYDDTFLSPLGASRAVTGTGN